MNAKATLISIAILVGTLFITSATPELMSISIIMLIVCFYCQVPAIITIAFISLIGSLLLENKAIYEANMLFTQMVDNNEQLWNKSVSDHIITAEVITLVNNKNGLNFNVKVNRIDGIETGLFKPIIRVRWRGYSNDYPRLPQLGQAWRFKVKLYAVNRETKLKQQQSSFYNFPHYLLSQNILFSANVKRGEIINSSTSLRQRYFQEVIKLLPENSNAMLLALSFGYRANITASQWQQFQDFGISHLIAISGLHVGLMFTFCYALIKIVLLCLGKEKNMILALLVSFVVAVTYVWLSGSSLPALRALVLLTLGCAYKLVKFKVTLLQMWLLMFMITIIISPKAIYGVSFLLSFGAIASVFIMLWYLNENRVKSNSAFQYYSQLIATAIKIQCCLFLLLLPFQVVIFSGFSWIAPLANFILIPLFSLIILPVLLFAVLITPFIPAVSKLLFFFSHECLNYLTGMLDTLSAEITPWVSLTHWLRYQEQALFVLIAYLFFLFIFMVKPVFSYLHCLIVVLMSVWGMNEVIS